MTRAVLLAAVGAAAVVGAPMLSSTVALDILLRYEYGDSVTESEIAQGLIKRLGY